MSTAVRYEDSKIKIYLIVSDLWLSLLYGLANVYKGYIFLRFIVS